MQDAALGRLAHWIHVKAESAGRRIWLVDPRYASQRCPACSHTDAANRPDQATFVCVACGHTGNADINAAVNVAQLGAQAEQVWDAAGRPSLERPKPRMRRGIKDKPKVALAAEPAPLAPGRHQEPHRSNGRNNCPQALIVRR